MKLIKRIFMINLIIILSFVFLPIKVQANDKIIEKQMESLNISSFIKEGEKYAKEAFPEIDVKDLLNDAVLGHVDNKMLYQGIWSILGKEIVSTVTILGSILIIIIIHSILKSISENLGNNSIGEITYYVEYIMIVTLIMSNFSSIINMVKESTVNLVGFMNSLIPILLALMMTTGSVASVSMIQPIILFIIIFIGNIITLIILPITLATTILGIVSNISDKVQIGKLSKFFKSSIIWLLGIITTIFVGILSFEGTLTSSIDGLTAKGVKAVTSNLIPVIGKALGDSVDTVLGCTVVLKNAIGVVGIIILISICVGPILKLSMLTMMYHFSASICEPLADKKIIKLLEQMGGTFKILLAIMFFSAILLIIGLTITIKISNSGIMYR